MRITYDSESDALYMYVQRTIADGEVKRVVTQRGTNVVLDFGARGELLGIEVLNARKLAPQLIADAEPIRSI